MRRSLVTAVLAAAIPVLIASPASPAPTVPPASAAQADEPEDRAGYRQIADELDLTRVVPALQAAFGARYGGYWMEVRRRDDVMHVGVVGATAADRTTVARITGRHARVVTDPVAFGYDELAAAHEEVAASLGPASGHFTVETDVATNRVVVRAQGADLAGTRATARDAARRSARKSNRPDHAPDHAADAIEVVPAWSIDLDLLGPTDATVPAGATRGTFPPYEAGLGIRVYVGSVIYSCTTGYLFSSGFGLFGSTAGHCGRVGGGVVIGSRIVDSIRLNTYHSDPVVRADVGMTSLSVLRWPSRPYIHGQGGHRIVRTRFANAQLSVGLRLCFEGLSSNGGNCGNVVRANSTICCDGAGHAFVFTCIGFPSIAGDSGGPVYYPEPNSRAVAAGMLSAAVTINGARSMCFTTVANIEARTGATIVRG